jgi:hypothetical protein
MLLAPACYATNVAEENIALSSTHQIYLKTLSKEQFAAIAAFQPGAMIASACQAGSGQTPSAPRILGLLATGKNSPVRADIQPVALFQEKNRWTVRSINSDIAKDAWGHDPIDWAYSIKGTKLDVGLKCAVNPYTDPDLSDGHGKLLDNKPFFPLSTGATGSLTCFGTSDTYNNWDCVSFSAKLGRFRLWYRKVRND